MKPLTLNQKIALCLVVVVVTIAGLSWASIRGFSSMKDRFVVTTDVTARKIGLAGDINMAVGDMLAAQRGMLLYTTWKNPSKVQESKQVFADRYELVEKDIAKIAPMLSSNEERRTVAVLVRDNAEWRFVFRDMERLCSVGQLTAAVQLDAGEAAPLYRELDDVTGALEQEQWALLQKDKERAAATFVQVKITSFAALALSFIIFILVLNTLRRISAALERSEREARERLREIEQIYNCSPVGMCLVDREHRYIRINDRLASLGGAPASEYIGRTVREMAPELADRLMEAYRPVLEEGESILNVETRSRAPNNGSERYELVCYSPFKPDNGEVKGVIVSVLDITDRKRAEQSVLEARALAQSTIDALASNICVLDETGTIIAVNRAWKEFASANGEKTHCDTCISPPCGWGTDVGVNYLEVCDRAGGPSAVGASGFAQGIREVLRGLQEVASVEYPCDSHGEKRWFMGRASRFTSGGLPRIVIQHIDISARRLAEIRISESEERFRTMADSCGAFMWVTNTRGEMVFVNRACREFFDVAYEEVEGFPWKQLFHPQDGLAFVQEFRRKIRDQLSFRAEARVLRRDGEWRTLGFNAEPRFSEDWEFLGYVGISADITERQRAERELKESEEKFRELAENIREVFWMMNGAGTEILYVSPAFEQIWGVPCGELYRNRKVWEESIVSEDRERALSLFRRQMQGEDIESEYRILTPGRELKWVRDRAFPVRNHEGRIARFVGVAEDITQRKWTEEALRQSAREVRESLAEIEQVYKYSPVGLCLRDRELRYLRVNERLAGLDGLAIKEHIGRTIHEVMPDIAERVVETTRPVLEHGEAVLNAEYHRDIPGDPNGYDYLVNHYPHKSDTGEVIGVMSSILDITERKRTEEALRRSEAEFRALFDGANDAIFIMRTSDNRILEVNDNACSQLGYSREELLGMWIPQINNSRYDTKFVRDRTAELLERGIVLFESTHQRKDGAPVPVEINMRLINYRGVSAGLAVARDIRERKAVEAAMLDAKEAAEEAVRAKSEFIANMSHEIRTPLNGVIGMTGLLMDSGLTPEQLHYAEAARDSSESLLSLINKILDFSKIEAGKLELESTDFNLDKLLEDVAVTLSVQAYAKGIEFLCFSDPETPAVFRGDAGRLRQILLNLAGNAVKFTSAGEVSVRATLEESSETEYLLHFSVRDTGIGIPEDKVGLLFNKFSQVDTATTLEFGGTGLGLAISKQLTEMMGGAIGVTTELGKGSEFWFTVCLGPGSQPAETSAVKWLTAQLNDVRVLVVDDNATSRESLTRQISFWGMRPTEVSGGPQALDVLYRAVEQNDPFRIAIIDMQMPGMDGGALGRMIKTDQRLVDTAMILLTSIGVRNRAKRPNQIGFSGWVPKPVSPDQLLKQLINALSSSSAIGSSAGPIPDAEALDSDCGDQRPFAGINARILVAEDNCTNQEVALGILKSLGLRGDAVANGDEAIKSLETIPYDLVLMDMRMPVMDGIDATAHIRDPHSSVLNHDIPIIAMTANVRKSDHDRCINAGMNGFILKPVSPKMIRESLERFLQKKNVVCAAAEQVNIIVSPEPILPVFDRRGLSERLVGDEQLTAKVIGAFLSDMPQQIEALKGFLKCADKVACGRTAHSIKGAAANVGGERLRQVALAMENASDAGDLEATVSRMASLELEFLNLKNAIAEQIKVGKIVESNGVIS